MQAGQAGLVKEFPAQSGPGEAQEFYANVYNILGDPSLQVYLDTPSEFNFNIAPVYSSEGFLDLSLSSSNGVPVSQAVISIMNDGDILAKGLTDSNGRFISSINVENLTSVEVYSNKGGFVQGHTNVVIEENMSTLVLLSLIHI